MRINYLNSKNIDHRYASAMLIDFLKAKGVRNLDIYKNVSCPSVVYVNPNDFNNLFSIFTDIEFREHGGFLSSMYGLRVDKLTFNTEKRFIESLEAEFNINITLIDNNALFEDPLIKNNSIDYDIGGVNPYDTSITYYDGGGLETSYSRWLVAIILVIFFILITWGTIFI